MSRIYYFALATGFIRFSFVYFLLIYFSLFSSIWFKELFFKLASCCSSTSLTLSSLILAARQGVGGSTSILISFPWVLLFDLPGCSFSLKLESQKPWLSERYTFWMLDSLNWLYNYFLVNYSVRFPTTEITGDFSSVFPLGKWAPISSLITAWFSVRDIWGWLTISWASF